MKSGSGEPTLFAQGSALGWELFGPQGADAQGVALGLTQSFPHFLGDAQRQMTVVNLNSNPRQIYFSRSRPSPSVFMGLDSHFVGAA